MKENSVFDIKTASKTSNTYLISEPSIGFASAKAFYAPKYNSYNNSTFLNYGVIGWFPNIELIQNKSSIIKFLNTQTKSINLYIEGVAENGDLISEFKTLTIN